MNKFILTALFTFANFILFGQGVSNSKIEVARTQSENVERGGVGNNTFKLSPKMLANFMIKNPTIKMLEATFPEYWVDGNYPEDGIIRYDSRYFPKYIVSAHYSLDKYIINEIVISHCTTIQIKSFKQLLIDYGFRIDVSTSDFSNTISRGAGESREYYNKSKSPITFIIISNQIKVIKTK